MKVKHIYITGCAKSGTTVLARMFHAFEDAVVMNEEVQLHEYVKYIKTNKQKKSITIGKRTEHTIFSNVISKDLIDEQIKLIKNNNVIIINCVRDGRFVVESWFKSWKVYNPFAWMASIMQSEKYKEHIMLTVHYEELVNNPEKVQNEIETLIKKKAVHNFNEYPLFVPEYCFASNDVSYKLRKLNSKEDNVPLTYLQEPNNIDFFDKLNLKLGYK